MFAHLHVHSEYSLLDGMCRVPDMARRAKELGMDSLAITDHGALYGVIPFYREARAAGIKPVLGCEVYVAPGKLDTRSPTEKSPYHLVLLARDETGYHNLLKMITVANLEGFYYKPRVDKDLLAKHHQGLIALSACANGELGRLLLEEREEDARKSALWYKEVFSDFYLEIQQHALPEQEKINKGLVALSRETGIPLIATNDVHYLNKDDSYAQDILLCIQTNNVVQTEKRPKMPGDSFYLKSPQEMADLFAELPDAISNTGRVAEMCHLDLQFGRLNLPEIELPPGKTPDEYLSDLARAGFATRYPDPPAETVQRLNYELDVIRQTSFANYFLVVWDIMSFVRKQKILFGVRGSAAASVVLYCLGITDIDPLSQRLVFERFLNVERKEMPDIDMDFQDDRRQEVIAYVSRKYGSERVAQIITFGTMGARAVIRDVGRALALSYADVDRLVRNIPPMTGNIDEALAGSPELKSIYDMDHSVRHLLDTSRKLEGIARHSSTHAAGVVISKERLVNVVPLQRPSRGDGEEINMTQFAMDDIAKIGLLKMDFLGLANLTILAKTKEAIARNRGIDIDLHHIPMDDAASFKLLSAGETTGVFQLEGGGMRRFIKDLKPTCFGDVAAMVALYRPGPMEQIPTFIKAKHGLIPVTYPHEALSQILNETYGVIVYQDQVLLIVQAFAGYSLGEADIVRKAMGKKIPEIMVKEKAKFLAGAVGKGFPPDLAGQVWSLIEPFAGYAFNKAHSVSYAMIAYQTAYLKANYAPEFMSALLDIDMGQPEKVASAVAECQRLGMKVLPPDVNHSGETFTIEKMDNASNPAIRFGLAAIKNVGAAAIRPIIAAREQGGPFKTIEDFCRRADIKGLNKRMLESMIKVGALDCLGDRGSLLAGIDRVLALAQQEQRLKDVGQATMFDLFGQSVDAPLPGIELPEVELQLKDKAAWEKDLLGVNFSDQGRPKLPPGVGIFCSQINGDLIGQSVVIAGTVTSARELFTKDRRPFMSATVEDFTGSIEVTAWNDVYERDKDIWAEGNALLLKGKVKSRGDRIQITCFDASLYQPEPAKEEEKPGGTPPKAAKSRRRLKISLSPTDNTDSDIARLKQIFDTLKSFPGRDEVHLWITDNGEATKLELADVATGCCLELERKLADLVGEQGFAVEQAE